MAAVYAMEKTLVDLQGALQKVVEEVKTIKFEGYDQNGNKIAETVKE